jgi:hypothetical protein
MGKKLEDYLDTDPAQLMALIAFKVDDMSDDKLPAITAHLKQLNDSVATNARNITKNDRRLCKSEARAELEDRYGRFSIYYHLLLNGCGPCCKIHRPSGELTKSKISALALFVSIIPLGELADRAFFFLSKTYFGEGY